MGTCWTQLFPPSPPLLTEKNLPSQRGKVFAVTGATSGIGFELARILYRKGGKVYIAARDKGKAKVAIESILSSSPCSISGHGITRDDDEDDEKDSGPGELEYLHLDLSDLRTVKPAAETLRRKETKIDVLWNNAGVSMVPEGSVSVQGHELHLATNCLGPFLFTKLLMPLLLAAVLAAAAAPEAAEENEEGGGEGDSPCPVRIIWSSSIMVDLAAPEGGIPTASQLDLYSPPPSSSSTPRLKKETRYAISKAGNWFLASEFGRRYGGGKKKNKNGIISITTNPGILDTQIWRHSPRFVRRLLKPFIYDQVFGAYTVLWAGLAREVTAAAVADGSGHGGYVIPWGRWHPCPREDILAGLRDEEEEGGTGRAKEFWEWCEEKTRDFG
ncbi:hypothetical protein VTN00DRAFT_8369 [Thermoascus crustaceus]|uniref:uncharacterized protein n=1 Tax=Thermoascus crustaceus TaxID=5088 RepID=UPI003743D2BC